jgi:hypothetical protein
MDELEAEEKPLRPPIQSRISLLDPKVILSDLRLPQPIAAEKALLKGLRRKYQKVH